MANSFKHPIRMLATVWHKMAGRFCFRLGRSSRARRHFEHVLMLQGDDFIAYLYLASLAYSARDYAGWRRELAHAQRTSPERYAQLKFPFELFEPPRDGQLFEEAGERATWRSFRLSSVGGSPDLDDTGTGERGMSSCPGGELRRFGDDFSSQQERRKFASLPPISTEDLAGVDLDRLTGSF
jgi:hypothetical protein